MLLLSWASEAAALARRLNDSFVAVVLTEPSSNSSSPAPSAKPGCLPLVLLVSSPCSFVSIAFRSGVGGSAVGRPATDPGDIGDKAANGSNGFMSPVSEMAVSCRLFLVRFRPLPSSRAGVPALPPWLSPWNLPVLGSACTCISACWIFLVSSMSFAISLSFSSNSASRTLPPRTEGGPEVNEFSRFSPPSDRRLRSRTPHEPVDRWLRSNPGPLASDITLMSSLPSSPME
mmetsp:Transcript_100559/g.288098  ORF Transcript_100559/g.288098 Transcript_100559/m.288098 type:complete len:231 (-) Transcript_100559:3527-4219(-)